MSQFYGISNLRGKKRLLEQKKFKCLGQLQMLRAVFSRFVDSQQDLDVISGERLYSLIHIDLHELNKCGITQKFLIEFIAANSKKRESKRFIDFLEGA